MHASSAQHVTLLSGAWVGNPRVRSTLHAEPFHRSTIP
jgi:hypothetical protein